MPKLEFKKGDVCVLVDPVTKNRIWLPLEDVTIRRNGVEYQLGKYLDDLEESKVSTKDFDQYKLSQRKILKKILTILETNVAQVEVNSLDVNELLDNINNMEEE